MPDTNADKTVLITGSSRGIGRAIAERLALKGYSVVLHCRERMDAAATVRDGIVAAGGKTPRILSFDIAEREACRAAIAADMDAHGAYYGVVCNAGIAR